VISIPVHIVTEGKAVVPTYAHEGDAGFDLEAAISNPVTIYPGNREVIPTGIKVAIPDGYELQIRSRSGMTRNYGIIVANAPGTIDSGYTGEIGVILANIDEFDSFTVQPGMKVAQGVLSPIVKAEFLKVESLGDTERGDSGFGSTGI
jgi:dUTP pyrophosphatase